MQILRHSYTTPNIGKVERGASVMAGILLIFHGLRQRSKAGIAMAVAGGEFLRRGITGFSYAYQAVGMRTAEKGQGKQISVPYELGVRVDRAVTVNKPREEVYRFWRNLENLPKFMQHIETVRAIDDCRSHWSVKGPAGRTAEWDAEIINDVVNELIGWRSMPGSTVANAGSVRFEDAAGGRGTEVKVSLQYDPPGGTVGALVAKLFHQEPTQQIAEDLRRFKMMLETGEVPTNQGQSSGRLAEKTNGHKKPTPDEVHHASEASFPASDAPSY
jgi:uncharacterized membrane protein